MSTSPRLQLPLLAPAQAQKHVTHNEALMRLDALAQLGVISDTMTAPPASPAAGDAYLLPAGAAGAWAGRSNQIALWQDGAWTYIAPFQGWRLWVASTASLRVFHNANWITPQPENVSRLGINMAPDNTRRLSVAADMTLLTASAASHRLTVNKSTTSDTATLVLQDGFSGRAELGLAGDDDFHVKVSPDGAAWREALIIERDSGRVVMPLSNAAQGRNLLINGGFQVNQRQFAGGALAAGIYGFDRWKAGPAGANATLSGNILTLASGKLVQIIDPAFFSLPTLAGSQLSFSVDGLSGGALLLDIAGQTGTLPAGSGRRGLTLTLPGTATGTIALGISPASGAVTFSRAKLEIGAQATAWAEPAAATELTFCQNYYFEMTAEYLAAGVLYDAYADNANALAPVIIPFPAMMRAAPTVSSTGTFTPTNILAADQPFVTQAHRHCAVIRPRGATAGRRSVTCTTGALLKFSAEL